MLANLGAIWKCRYFWLSLVKIDLRSRYRGSVLGMGWSLLHPIAMTVILCVVFTSIFHVEIGFYGPYLMAGLACWQFLVNVTIQGCQCFFQGEHYIRQYPAPMAIYPLRTVLACGFHFGLALLLVVALTCCVRAVPGFWALLSLVPTALLLLVLGWSLAVIFGLTNVRFRDTHHLCEVGFQVLFYGTPVMYPPEVLAGRRLGQLMQYNPLMPFLTLLRDPLLEGRPAPAQTFGVACLLVLMMALTAVAALRRGEKKLIFFL
jgi:ABC-type polysaccharide/polyol phosphate export permease